MWVPTPSGKDSLQGEFLEYPPLLRQAISIARHLQEPLVELSRMCSADDDLMCVQFHPMQVSIRLFHVSSTPPGKDSLQGEFLEYPPLLWQAISIARHLQEPLVELSRMCNADDDLMCVQFHPMQELGYSMWVSHHPLGDLPQAFCRGSNDFKWISPMYSYNMKSLWPLW